MGHFGLDAHISQNLRTEALTLHLHIGTFLYDFFFFAERARRVAGGLAAAGVGHGDAVIQRVRISAINDPLIGREKACVDAATFVAWRSNPARTLRTV